MEFPKIKTATAVGYKCHAFWKYQLPYGGDQCKYMTAWTPRVSRSLWDMQSHYSGAEGLEGAELIKYT